MFQFTKPSRAVDRVFLHCSASDNPAHDNIRTIRKWHVTDNGWSDIGYHYYVNKAGEIYDGRPVSKTPAAQYGHNTGTIAICCGGLHKENFTEAQYETLREMCKTINAAYDGKVTFHGHREVASKACPVYDYKAILKLDGFGRLGLTGAKKQKLEDKTSDDPGDLPVLRLGARGEAVRLAQRGLLIKDDGIFGPKTKRAVMDFQKDNGLEADGVVGKNTWKKLLKAERVKHSGKD